MKWKLKDILMIAVCAVLFGVLFLGATYAGGALYALLLPLGMPSLGYEPFYGLYFMAVAFAVYVIRKPGVGIVAEILAAVIETLMGNFFGPIIILSGFVQGAGFELIFALTGYKKFNTKLMVLAAVICSCVTMVYNLIVSGYNLIALPVLALMLAVRIVSAIVIDALVTPKLANGLAKAGVLNGYAISETVSGNLDV